MFAAYRNDQSQGVAMIGKKMLMWAAAGMLSVASIPAIAATRTHIHQLHKKTGTTALHASKSAKSASHVKLISSHAKKSKHVKLFKATKNKTAHASLGVLAMHSGHSSLVKPVSTKTTSMKKSTHSLLAATHKVKTVH
jgi:hypothetical protein